MIYTLTMNPALDYIMELDSLNIGGLNRAKSTRIEPAGKGITVSRALDSLGVENIAIAAPVEKPRINVKLHCGGEITEVNGTCELGAGELAKIRDRLGELKTGDILIASGSLPLGVEADFYAQIARELSAKGVCVIVDTSGEPLRRVAQENHAFLIAPNEVEFADINECNCNVLLSLGAKGAKFTGINGEEYFCPVQQISENGYTIGAGDTLLAGFVAEWVKSKDFEKALNAGVELSCKYVSQGL